MPSKPIPFHDSTQYDPSIRKYITMKKSMTEMTAAEINKLALMITGSDVFKAALDSNAQVIRDQSRSTSPAKTAIETPTPRGWMDTPIAITLTPHEIAHACVDSCHIFWISTKSQLDYESFGVVVASNPRTGVICRVGAFEALSPRSTEVLDSDLHYIVELEINESTLVFEWITNDMEAGFAHIKKCAHESFIKVCTFAGIKAGYGLVLNADTY